MATKFLNINKLVADPDLDAPSFISGATRVAYFSFKPTPRLDQLLNEIDLAGCTERDAYKLSTSWAASLPEDLQRAILYFVRCRSVDALVLKGLPVGNISKISTPIEQGTDRLVGSFEALCMAVAMLYGSPIGYSTQQNGRLLNDIVPVEKQSAVSNHSGGFEHRFGFHTEDSFMQNPPNFIQLGCVRNPTKTPVTISGLGRADTDNMTDSLLREPHFRIGINPGQSGWKSDDAYLGPLLTGPKRHPFLRFNDKETSVLDGELATLKTLERALNKNAVDLALEPGDVAIINNTRLAHARGSYAAKCDGTDRWLLRLVIYRNLDVIHQFIPDAEFPIIHPGASE
ncbi:MAG TPA: TauD/TfdA family dioxygenase [Pseudonocardiaceae bacterium]|nr:TauD/TfdA family dioxygenase [Pseudonocardiaceae bacterium]